MTSNVDRAATWGPACKVLAGLLEGPTMAAMLVEGGSQYRVQCTKQRIDFGQPGSSQREIPNHIHQIILCKPSHGRGCE